MLRSPLQVPCGTLPENIAYYRYPEVVWHMRSNILLEPYEGMYYILYTGRCFARPFRGTAYYNVNNLLAYNAHYVKWGLL
jgi:hypothetical protein